MLLSVPLPSCPFLDVVCTVSSYQHWAVALYFLFLPSALISVQIDFLLLPAAP